MAWSQAHVPTWSGAFTAYGHTYPYRMVGTNPGAGPAVTHIPVVIIPLRVMVGRQVFDGSQRTQAVVSSPIFQPVAFATGVTQYGDAMLRAEFWSQVQSSNWHVLLDQPRVLPTITVNVPPGDGAIGTLPDSGTRYAEVNQDWFELQVQQWLQRYRVSPAGLTIFLADNTVLSYSTPVNCPPDCTAGMHNEVPVAGNTYTYIFATWADLHGSQFATQYGLEDISILSHEVVEWLNDPFINNVVPDWQIPPALQAFYGGCSNLLEVGDPVLGQIMTVPLHRFGYHLSDVAYLPWFARSQPSGTFNHQYDYLGALNEPSQPC